MDLTGSRTGAFVQPRAGVLYSPAGICIFCLMLGLSGLEMPCCKRNWAAQADSNSVLVWIKLSPFKISLSLAHFQLLPPESVPQPDTITTTYNRANIIGLITREAQRLHMTRDHNGPAIPANEERGRQWLYNYQDLSLSLGLSESVTPVLSATSWWVIHLLLRSPFHQPGLPLVPTWLEHCSVIT